MAESMKGLNRSHRCGEVSNALIGQTVTVMGWVQKQRNKGGIIFVDLRDRSGILQIIFEESECGAEAFAKAEKLRSEFVVAVVGTVNKRAGAANENLATGDIEIVAKNGIILYSVKNCKSRHPIPPLLFVHFLQLNLSPHLASYPFCEYNIVNQIHFFSIFSSNSSKRGEPYARPSASVPSPLLPR